MIGELTNRAMRRFVPTVMLAAVLTGLNAVKPLHVDDPTYSYYACRIAHHPLDPYGFSILYFNDPLPALHVLAPPLLPAWWALAIRLFGERPLLWKLWLFPFALLFAASLASLLRRFAPSLASSLLIMLVLSPVFLPGLNMMIDVPALALSLAALALFFCACDRNSLRFSVLAGSIAGLAMQTKYTGFLAPPVLLAYALLHGRMRLGLAAAAAAVCLFSAWELALVWRYGESHFLYHSSQNPFNFLYKIGLIISLFPTLGAVDLSLLLLALTLGRVPRRWLLAAALLAALPYLLLFWTDPVVLDLGYDYLHLTGLLFAINGAVLLLCLAWVSWRLLRPVQGQPIVCPFSAQGRVAWFLVLWVAFELTGYVVLSPFPAVRRIMGLTVAAVILLGYFGEQMSSEPLRRKRLYGVVVATVFLGFGYFSVDYLEARAEQQAAYEAAQRIREQDPQADIWYAGYWGFQYYAEEVGMKQAVPLMNANDAAAQRMPPTQFHRGDWLVIPGDPIPRQELDLDRPELELKDHFYLTDAIPIRTLIYYYGGWPPLRRSEGSRIDVDLFRIKSDFIARLTP
jgi:hypothetical protein